jgi:FkbM family methyltransferase
VTFFSAENSFLPLSLSHHEIITKTQSTNITVKNYDSILLSKPKYLDLLGREQALDLLRLFDEIERGKYDRSEVYSYVLKGIKYPIYIRAIRADMQSFVNTFIDPYLEMKPYMAGAKFVIDAGSNIGYTALLFANWWPEAKVVGLEPDRENFELAVKNTERYGTVLIHQAGLWNETADLQIEAGQEDGFVVRKVIDKSKVKKENLSRGISIDEIIKDVGTKQIDFLKFNIEGSEKEVFAEHYTYWLPNTKCMLVELHDGKNAGCSNVVFARTNEYQFAVAETASYGILFVKEKLYRDYYAKWYKDNIYKPNINKDRFPNLYLEEEK